MALSYAKGKETKENKHRIRERDTTQHTFLFKFLTFFAIESIPNPSCIPGVTGVGGTPPASPAAASSTIGNGDDEDAPATGVALPLPLPPVALALALAFFFPAFLL
jgi:hypothetical protein